MVSSGFTIIMDAAQVETVLAKTALEFPSYVNSWLVETATLTKEEMESRAPVGVAGLIGQGISHNIGTTYNSVEGTAFIGPTDQVPYADGVELGTSPHMPPTDPDGSLAQWCELHDLNVWAVAKSISRKGTKPHPFVQPTYEVVAPIVAERFTKGVTRFLEGRAI